MNTHIIRHYENPDTCRTELSSVLNNLDAPSECLQAACHWMAIMRLHAPEEMFPTIGACIDIVNQKLITRAIRGMYNLEEELCPI